MLITLAVIGIYTFVVLAGWEKDPISAAKHYDWADKGWARAYMPFFLVRFSIASRNKRNTDPTFRFKLSAQCVKNPRE